MENNPSIGHMLMALGLLLFMAVIAQSLEQVTWLEVYRVVGGAFFGMLLSRIIAGFE